MEEYCVFCGDPIQPGAVYCQDCAPIVETLDPDKRRVLEAMLADETAREVFRQNWKRVKECMHDALQAVKNAVDYVADWLMEMASRQEEGKK